jgi:hypothetical protein
VTQWLRSRCCAKLEIYTTRSLPLKKECSRTTIGNMSQKRPRLMQAFGKVPEPRVEVAPSVTSAVSSKATAFMLPPTLSKYGLTVPTAPLKVHESKGPVITISQAKKPSFTFGSPVVNDKPVTGFAFLGYSLSKGGDSAPPTGCFGRIAEARAFYTLKNSKLFTAIDKVPSATPDVTIEVPMSELGSSWGEMEIPTLALASNTNALLRSRTRLFPRPCHICPTSASL